MIRTAVFEAIASQISCQADTISLESKLEDLGIDSLGAITILYELEERFDVEIPNEAIDSIKNVHDIVNYLEFLLENR